MQGLEEQGLRTDLPEFRPGDPVRVHVLILEGDKERVQVFEGVVISRKGGQISSTFTVRKVSYGVGVERTLPLQSPAVTKVEIKSRGFVRRSRLYYLRELRGKKARLRAKIRDVSGLISEEERERLESGTADDVARVAEEAQVAAEAEVAATAEPEAEAAEPEADTAPEAEADEASKKDE